VSVKPTVVPVFNTGLVNSSPLTGIHQSSGYVNSETPTSQESNYLFSWLSKWSQYLSDAAFQGASSFDTTVTLAANQHAVISGTGLYKRGIKIRKIPVCAASSATGSTASTQWLAAAIGQTISFPIELEEGVRLLSVTARVSCSGAADVLTLKLLQAQPTIFSAVQLGATATSVGHAGALEALAVTSLTEVASSGNAYNYLATLTATGYTSGSGVYALEITTDVP